MEYYKKIDKSIFRQGFTVPVQKIQDFTFSENIELGSSRKIIIQFQNIKYSALLCHVDIKNKKSVHQVRWDNNLELINALKKEYIQTYFAIESQNYNAKADNKIYRTNLLGGNQEVLIFRSLQIDLFEIETFIKIETPYDNIFKKFVDENIFGWLSKVGINQLISKSTKWLDIKELSKHEETPYVIYYLVDQNKKELYIGSAIRLGDRVKPNRNEIPGWNIFRYEIIHPKYHELLREIEYHSIMNFVRFLDNNGNLSNIKISEYKLVNKDYKYYLK